MAFAPVFWCAPPARAATLSGLVVENATGRPLARTTVILQARRTATPVSRLRRLTGPGGEFQFTGLPGGIYFLRAERKGFASYEYGQKGYGEPGTPIILEQDGSFSAVLRLKRLGVITGKVMDENQVGLEGVVVLAYRVGKNWEAAATAQTDDRGVYRLRGLKPGRYVVKTAAFHLEGGVGLMPTYYGPALSAREASVIRVSLDQEAAGVDIQPRPGRLARLSGRLTGGSASEVLLMTETGPRRSRVREGGRFDFGQIEPGRYALVVEPEAAGGRAAAFLEVQLGEADQEVTLPLRPAPTFQVDCVTDQGQLLSDQAISVFVRRAGSGGAGTRARCGVRTLLGPGDWEIAVAPPLRYYIAAILDTASGEQARRFRLEPGEDISITVLVGTRPATVKGKVTIGGTAAVGAPVFLRAADADLAVRLGGLRTVRTGPEGEYSFAGLPPGRYEVICSYQVREEEPETWPPGRATFVDVAEGEEVVQDLTVTEIR